MVKSSQIQQFLHFFIRIPWALTWAINSVKKNYPHF